MSQIPFRPFDPLLQLHVVVECITGWQANKLEGVNNSDQVRNQSTNGGSHCTTKKPQGVEFDFYFCVPKRILNSPKLLKSQHPACRPPPPAGGPFVTQAKRKRLRGRRRPQIDAWILLHTHGSDVWLTYLSQKRPSIHLALGQGIRRTSWRVRSAWCP